MGLEVHEDIEFSRREEAWQRVGYVLLAGVVMAAFVGLLGAGPLSQATASVDGLTVDYERIGRNGSWTTMLVRPGRPDGDKALVVAISRSWLDGFRLDTITPTPTEMTARGDTLLLTWTTPPDEVVLELRYLKAGFLAGELEALGRRVPVQAFVLP